MVVAGDEIGDGDIEVTAGQIEPTNLSDRCLCGVGWFHDVEMSGSCAR